MMRLPPNRAFLVQLVGDTEPTATAPAGRVEHVSSGRSTRFRSREELWEFISQILAEAKPGEEAPTQARKRR